MSRKSFSYYECIVSLAIVTELKPGLRRRVSLADETQNYHTAGNCYFTFNVVVLIALRIIYLAFVRYLNSYTI